MAVTIRREGISIAAKTIFYIVVIVLVALILYGIWYYVIRRYLRGELFPIQKVACDVAPETPTGLTGTVSGNRALLSWNETATTDNYIIYMGTSASFPLPAAERVISAFGNSIAILNLIPGTYYFKIASSNSCGNSSISPEIILTVTTWPSKFKLCKKDSPNICLSMDTENGPTYMSTECSNNICELSYPSELNIKRENANLCLFEFNPGGAPIELPTSSNLCNMPTDWTIDLNTGRVTSLDDLCLGADSIVGTPAYNTQCAVIFNPDDTRYAWTVQALTF